jgi:hypothetical protein
MTYFELQPNETQLQQLAEDYFRENTGELERETRAFEAGKKIRQGDISIENLEVIVKWKSPRVVHYLCKNSPNQISAALERVVVPETSVQDAIEALMALHGVGLPVASAILTAIFPERYTIIDFRALEALGQRVHDEKFYEEYLAFCKRLADSGVIKPQVEFPAPTALRALDRALWQWSASQEQNPVR